MNKEQTPRILCKLDIEKADDLINCVFHVKVLEDMGFGRIWIKWIVCINTIRFSFYEVRCYMTHQEGAK